MIHNLLIRVAISFIVIVSSLHLFGDTFIVGWLTYIVFSLIDITVKHYLREDKDESK